MSNFEKIMAIFKEYAYNSENQAGEPLLIISEEQFEKIAVEIVQLGLTD